MSRPPRLTWDQYKTAWAALHGGFDVRRANPAVRGWIRLAYSGGFVLARLNVPPAAVTAFGLLLCVLVPVAAVFGPQGALLAAVLVLLAGVADAMDGAVAVVAGRTSRLGFVYDSVADRIGEACWLAAFWLIGAPGPLVVVVGAVSWLHEYVRARAGSAGMREIGVVTVGERPTRVSVALVGLLLAGAGGLLRIGWAADAATFAAGAWLLLAVAGLAQLAVAVHRTLR